MVDYLLFCRRIEFFRSATVRINDLENVAGRFEVSVTGRSDGLETFDVGIVADERLLVWL